MKEGDVLNIEIQDGYYEESMLVTGKIIHQKRGETSCSYIGEI